MPRCSEEWWIHFGEADFEAKQPEFARCPMRWSGTLLVPYADRLVDVELASRSEPLPVFCPDLAKASLRIGIVWVNYNQDSRGCEWADSRSPTPECLEDRDPGGKSGYDNISNESLPGLFANRRSVPQVRSKVDFGLQACADGLSGRLGVGNPQHCRRDKYEKSQ